jgi:hypothetical protein
MASGRPPNGGDIQIPEKVVLRCLMIGQRVAHHAADERKSDDHGNIS